MLSRSQERLLRHLGTFPDALSQAWDVPRALSLPGLSDAMGVVRSGLNQPLTALIEAQYISVRVAHVIGGGSRRRQVYHITETGRAWLTDHVLQSSPEPSAVSSLQGETEVQVVGRAAELNSLSELVEHHQRAVVSGLSGVGKTTLLRAWVAQRSGSIRWATMDEFSDASSLVSAWCTGGTQHPTDDEAMLEWLVVQNPSVLVVDDVHLLDSRHEQQVVDLLNGLHERGLTLVLSGRLPLPDSLEWPVLHLGTLSVEDGHRLLGEHLETEVRMNVAKALDGHPMALHLYSEGDKLPEAGEDIQAFVEQTMLNGLSDDGLNALDRMVLFPRPLPSDLAMGDSPIDELDDRALLRWSPSGSNVEIQHLVRNVRRTMLSDERLRALHEQAAAHWASHIEVPAYAVLHLYHHLALDSDAFPALMEERFESLVAEQSGALAVVYDRATQRRPDREELHYWAGRIALHRQEVDRIRHHMDHVETESMRNELAYGLALVEGNSEEAERLLEAQLDQASDVQACRWLVSAAVQRLDDRLFDEPHEGNLDGVRGLLQRIRLPEHVEMRASVTVSITLIQHTLALLEGNREQMEALVQSLESLSHKDDPIVLHARLKTHLAFELGSSNDLETLYKRAVSAQPSSFHEALVGLTYAEHLHRASDPAASTVHAALPPPTAWPEPGTPHHRYAARWWYLNGHLDPAVAAASLREAARWFRQAGCLKAARSVARKLHRVL